MCGGRFSAMMGKEVDEMDPIKTGAVIRSQRQKNGMTQLELAEKLCVSDKTVSKWECGVSQN